MNSINFLYSTIIKRPNYNYFITKLTFLLYINWH